MEVACKLILDDDGGRVVVPQLPGQHFPIQGADRLRHLLENDAIDVEPTLSERVEAFKKEVQDNVSRSVLESVSRYANLEDKIENGTFTLAFWLATKEVAGKGGEPL